MGRQGKKQKKKLGARIAGWESIKGSDAGKDKENPVSGFYMRKPGSMKK